MNSDIWTSQSNDTFTYVTTHSNWKSNKKIISFCLIYFPHDGSAIYDSFTSTFREFDTQRKFFSIIFDNASNNTNVIVLFVRVIRASLLSEMFHMRCVCYIINLIVLQDGFKLISPSLEAMQFVI